MELESLYKRAKKEHDAKMLDFMVDDAIMNRDRTLMVILAENRELSPVSLWKLYKYCLKNYCFARFLHLQTEFDPIIKGIISHPHVTYALLRRFWEESDFWSFRWPILTAWAKKKKVPDDIVDAILESECDEALSELCFNPAVSAKARELALKRIDEVSEF